MCSGGYYQQAAASGEAVSERTPPVSWGDLTASVKVRLSVNQLYQRAGLLVRRTTGVTSGYFLALTRANDTYDCGIYKYVDGQPSLQVPGTGCTAPPGEWVTLGARVISGRIEMLVNGAVAATWQDASPLSATNFALHTLDGTADFDDVTVYSASSRSYYHHGAQRVAMRQTTLSATGSSGTVSNLHGDHLGSASVASQTDGTLVTGSRAYYYPYGGYRGTPPTGMPTEFAFTGERLAEIGLYQMGARWFSSRLARWTSPDSIVPNPTNPQTLNRYMYVRGNPLRLVDPSGHCSGSPGAATNTADENDCWAAYADITSTYTSIWVQVDCSGAIGPLCLNKPWSGADMTALRDALNLIYRLVGNDMARFDKVVGGAIFNRQGSLFGGVLGDAGAVTNSAILGGQITLFDSGSGSYELTRWAFLHEIGHQFSNRTGDNIQWEFTEKLGKLGGAPPISDYATTSPSEDFAESFAAWAVYVGGQPFPTTGCPASCWIHDVNPTTGNLTWSWAPIDPRYRRIGLMDALVMKYTSP
jgi:RHS repeat-associated protein